MEAGQRADVRDAVAHRAGADHGDRANLIERWNVTARTILRVSTVAACTCAWSTSIASIASSRRSSGRGASRRARSISTTYARDMWPRMLLAHRDGAPAPQRPYAVVWPEHVREVVAVVKLAREQRIPIVPYGGGSGVCGGAVPMHGGITIDTKRMQQLRSVHARGADLRRRGRAQRRAVRARARAPRLHVRPLSVVDLLLDRRRLARDACGRPAVDEVRQGRRSRRRADGRHRPRRDDRDRRPDRARCAARAGRS